MQVRVGGREVTDEDWASARARELFYLFLTHPGGLRKEEAVEMLAPEAPSGRANSVFHSNLYRLRRALYQESIVKRHGAYMLNPEGEFESDIAQFEEMVEKASEIAAGSEERADGYQQALALYKGPFAEAFYSEWAATVRQRLAGQADEAFSVLAGYHAGRNEFEDAASCMERVLRGNPYNEEAAFELAKYRLAAGQASAALRFLDDFRRTYEDELGEDLPAASPNCGQQSPQAEAANLEASSANYANFVLAAAAILTRPSG